LGECCVCEWRGFWILRFWEMPFFSNIAFFWNVRFSKKRFTTLWGMRV